MNKIIILGHPDSGYGLVESLLMDCGMKQALPSRREGLLPKDIHRILREAHNLPETHTIVEERGFHPVEIGPVWHGMALDLLLGNLGQEPWGWSDPQTLFFSDYWQSLDPESVFILVYDSPASVLREAIIDPEAEDKDTMIRSRLDNWAAYNSAILHFFFQHMDRCILVHSRQPHRDFRYCLDEIQAKMNALLPITGTAQQLVIQDTSLVAESRVVSEISVPDTQLTTASLLHENQTSRFFIEFQLDQHPHYVELYQELQAAASIPLQQEESTKSFGTEAWFAWLLERRSNAETMDQLRKSCGQQQSNFDGLQQEHQAAILQCSATREELEQTRAEKQSLVDEATAQAREWTKKLEDSKREAESHWETLCTLQEEKQKISREQATMLLLLRNIQNELESSQIEKSNLRLKLDQQALTSQNDSNAQLLKIKQLERKHQEHSNAQVLKIRQLEKNHQEHSNAQVLKIRQLERNHQEHSNAQVLKIRQLEKNHQEDRNALILKIKQLEMDKSALIQTAAQSVERVKRQLSYRLGSTLVSRSRSLGGWLGMPLALLRVLADFNKDRQ